MDILMDERLDEKINVDLVSPKADDTDKEEIVYMMRAHTRVYFKF